MAPRPPRASDGTGRGQGGGEGRLTQQTHHWLRYLGSRDLRVDVKILYIDAVERAAGHIHQWIILKVQLVYGLEVSEHVLGQTSQLVAGQIQPNELNQPVKHGLGQKAQLVVGQKSC